MDRSRRAFLTFNLKSLFTDAFQSFSKDIAQPPISAPSTIPENHSFFSSFDSCYAFLAEVSLEELQQDAYKLGLDPTGKDKYEIAKMLFP